MPKPSRIQHDACHKRADHVMQSHPIGGQTAGRQPDQPDSPTVIFAQSAHQSPDQHRRKSKSDKKSDLPPNPVKIKQDQRQHRPDCHVIQTGIAQDPLPQRRPQDRQIVQKQHQNRQCCHRAGHADPQHSLRRAGIFADPARCLNQQHGGPAAKRQRHQQRQPRSNPCFCPLLPGFFQIKLQPGGPHEHHYRPPGHPVQGGDDRRGKYGRVIAGEYRAQRPRPKQNTTDDLHHDQRQDHRCAQDPPQRKRQAQDDQHGNQEQFGCGQLAPPGITIVGF